MPFDLHPAVRAIGCVFPGFVLLSCSGLPSTANRQETKAVKASASSPLRDGAKPFYSRHPGQSGIRPIRNGAEALAARIALSSASARSLDVQYYIWHEDASGRRLACELMKAADRGVRVRMLLDDMGSTASDESLLVLNGHQNVEIRVFNPVTYRRNKVLGMLANFGRTNHRMHNKVFVADNQVAIVGGRNIGDEYFAADEAMNFADFDVLAAGMVVGEVSQSFDSFWNHPLSINIAELAVKRQASDEYASLKSQFERRVKDEGVDARILKDTESLTTEIRGGLRTFVAAKATAVGDDPAKASGSQQEKVNLVSQLRPKMLAARVRLILVSPYFVPSKKGVELLAELSRKGVEVIVLTNSLASNDVPIVHASYRRYRKPLLRAGVRLHEFKSTVSGGGSSASLFATGSTGLHAKTFTFDDLAFYVGSMNLDPRSIRWNTEAGILVESPELASELARNLEKVIDRGAYRVDLSGGRLVWTGTEAGAPVTWLSEPQASRGLRFKTWLLGWLPVEKQI